jgi:CubicO group peptidase (beta-lactamase class C family)
MKKLLRKFLKYTLYTVLGLLITANLFVILTGRFYLYKGVANTYLVGETAPTIYDLDVFPYATLHTGEKDEFALAPEYNKRKLSAADRAYLEKLETRSFIVIKNDSILFEEYWDPHDENVVSNSFSIAKTLVALLVGIAVEEGHIKSLDDPVARYIPEFKNAGREVITIRHLLTMSSGLDWEESGKNPLSDNAESYYGEDLYGHVTRQKLISTPGKVFKYQSGNSQLLGFIVEKATGQDLTRYAEEKIWKKIGVKHDAYWSLDREGGAEKAFCCLYATARDFARIGQVILHEGKYGEEQIIPLWFYHEMIAPAALDTEDGIKNTRYGLHIWTYASSMGQVNYCRGISGQYIITVPKENLLIVRIGEKRSKNVEIDPAKRGDRAYMQKIEPKVGHSACLFRYLRIAQELTKNQK